MSNQQDTKHKKPNVPTLRLGTGGVVVSLHELVELPRKTAFIPKNRYVSTENLKQDFQGLAPYESEEAVKGIRFEVGDTLLANIRPYLKKTWLASFQGGCSADVICFHPKAIWPNYLYFVIANDTFISYVMEACKGSKMPRGDKNWILEKPVFVPPIEEQQKASRFLSLIDRRIAVQNKIIEEKKSLLKRLNDWLYERANKIPFRFRDITCTYNGLSGKSAEDFGKGSPFVTYLNILNNQIVSENNYGLVAIGENENQNQVQYGDVLLTLSSETPEEVGVASVYLGDEVALYLNSFSLGMRFKRQGIIEPSYAPWLFSTKAFREHIFPFAQGSTRYNLNVSSFLNSVFEIPKIEEQLLASKLIGPLSKEIECNIDLLARYKAMKQYLLASLFI